MNTISALASALVSSLTLGFVGSALLALKSLKDYTQAGPKLPPEVLKHYAGYSAWALVRLAGWAALIVAALAFAGHLAYISVAAMTGRAYDSVAGLGFGALGVFLGTALQFCRHLLHIPGSIVASSHYRAQRFYKLWSLLTPARLTGAFWTLAGLALAPPFAAAVLSAAKGDVAGSISLATSALALAAIHAWSVRAQDTRPARTRTPGEKPNIFMIGADTLRADRLGSCGYPRSLTPHIDALAARGAQFLNCYVPCARTAPSLISLFTGTWPHHHGVRDNFVTRDALGSDIPALPALAAAAGYRTCAIGDWAAGDLAKFPLGFMELDVPEDQWNIKYLLRQGPKDLRLFLSLFTHNRFGKRFLPELYYLAGVPLSREVTAGAKAKLSELAADGRPFLLNVFMATTHPPFGSEHPYYDLYCERDYAGGSKFVMERLTDPFEIIRRQGDGRKEFDLDQIINLYDGCVRSFDDKVGELLAHLDACGLAQNTIVVLYSDHGMEFFEHDTWGQGNSVVGDFSARIPLIISDPRRRRPALVREVTRSVDVAPTLLQLMGLPVPAHTDGVSLVDSLEAPQNLANLHAYAETGIWLTHVPGMPDDHLRYPDIIHLLEVPDKKDGTLAIRPEFQQQVIKAKDRMLREGRWKLVYQPLHEGPAYKLFDLFNDPGCLVNLSAAHPDICTRLREKMDLYLASDPALQQASAAQETRCEARAAPPARRRPLL